MSVVLTFVLWLQYLIGIGACLGVLLVCAVSSFTLSGRLAATYESQWSSSSLSCDIGLYGCSNCTSTEFEECSGVSKDASGYWVECGDDDDSSDSNSFSGSSDQESSASGATGNGTCWQGMTVLNDPEDQGYEPNDVRRTTIQSDSLENGLTDFYDCRSLNACSAPNGQLAT